jgi:hypothetical protein
VRNVFGLNDGRRLVNEPRAMGDAKSSARGTLGYHDFRTAENSVLSNFPRTGCDSSVASGLETARKAGE